MAIKAPQIEDFSRFNILAVDDVQLNRLLVQKMLSRFNFRIREAANGLEAVREVLNERPDLILLDMMMPQMDGFEFLEWLKSSPQNASIPVIVLSALNSNEDIVRAYNLGAKDFITKPIPMDKLFSSVSAQLGI